MTNSTDQNEHPIADRWRLNTIRRPKMKDTQEKIIKAIYEDVDKDFIDKVEAHPVIRCNLSRHWRLMPGMLVVGNKGIPARVITLQDNRVKLETGLASEWFDATPDKYWPVLDDASTLGCLLAILREVRGMCSCFETVVGWRVYSAGGTLWSQGKSEGDALVSALESAP